MQQKIDTQGSFGLALLWFGAAVSIAEILTGAALAPIGFMPGVAAIIIGHLIGALIFYLVGRIGASSKLSAIQSAHISFGHIGVMLFSLLNLLQLIGWTAVMIVSGADAMKSVISRSSSAVIWCLVIGGLIAVWILIGVKNLAKVNLVVVSLLFVFCLVLLITVYRGWTDTSPDFANATFGFGAALELSVTMPLSWMPMVADYTRNARHKKYGPAASAAGYFFGSCMMYLIGLGAAIYAGSSQISAILQAAGIGFIASFIVIFSTVTTTFLDAYSGGVSLGNLFPRVPEKVGALLVCVVGTCLTIVIPMSQYENFLYLIGSVFAPMFAILITDFFILGRRSAGENKRIYMLNLMVWGCGVLVYHLLLRLESPVGATLPTMLFVILLAMALKKFSGQLAET